MRGPNVNSRARAAPSPRAPERRESIQNLARFAAATAADVGTWLADQRERRRDIGSRAKSVGDPVTDLDVAAEHRLRDAIARRWPQHGFIGEETGFFDLDRSHVWVVDPIDGTANFAAGLYPWGVSVACLRDGEAVAGAVYAHPEGVTVVAALGRGARAGRVRLRLPGVRRLSADSIIGVQWLRGPRQLEFVPPLLGTGTRVRVYGCTVVQLCDVARGRLLANVQEQGRIWDIAAAGLIVQEAGGVFSGWDGRPIFPCGAKDLTRHHPSVGASAAVHRLLVRLLPRAAVSTA